MPRGIPEDHTRYPHGTWKRYYVCKDDNGKPCEGCRRANSLRGLISKIRVSEGVRQYVPANDVRRYLILLDAHGMGSTTVSRLVGVSPEAIRRLRTGEIKNVNVNLRKKILSVTLKQNPKIPIMAHWLRIRALMALGYRREDISALVGKNQLITTPGRASAKSYVMREHAQELLNVCIIVGNTPGPSEYTRALMRGRGVLPPAAYDAERFYDINWDGNTDDMLLECPA